jgi:Flp pilus assembly pilin Flp
VAARRLSRIGRKAEEVSVGAGVNGVSITAEGETVMKNLLARLVRDDEGQDIIEYALLAGLITTGVVVFITAVGVRVLGLFTALNSAIGGVAP